MAENSKQAVVGIAGMFDTPDGIIDGASAARDAGYSKWDCHTPYPVHGLDDAMGIKPSIMPYLTIPAGVTGAFFAKTMQWYMSDFDYPLMVGGKPLFSLPAFIPVTFELFVLFAAFATLFGILLLCRLVRWHSPLYDSGLMAQVTSSRFCVYLDAEDEKFSEEAATALLKKAGCEDVRILYDTD